MLSKLSADKHIKMAKHKCEECPRMFVKLSSLEMHKLSHSNEKLFTCEICQRTFKYNTSLSRHVREQHLGRGRKSVSSTLDGKQHNEQESSQEDSSEKGENIVEVTTRSHEAFNEYSNVTLSVNSKEDRFHQCALCDEVFVKHSKWLKHKQTHNHDMSFTCKICSKCFMYKSSFTRHVREQHFGLSRNSNSSNSSRVKHKLHKDIEEKAAESNVSEERSSSTLQTASTLHMNKKDNFIENQSGLQDAEQDEKMSDSTQGEPEVPYDKLQNSPAEFTCEICETPFKHKPSLIRHVKEQHYGLGRKRFRENFDENQTEANCDMMNDNSENRVDCDYDPDKQTVENGTFSVVLETLLSDQQRNENECSSEMQLNELNELNGVEAKSEHFVTSDINVENSNMSAEEAEEVNVFYMCDDCPRIFPCRADLEKHKRVHSLVHSIEQSFSCEICKQTFKYNASLKRHVKEVHYGLGRKGGRIRFDEGMSRNNGSSSVESPSNPELEFNSYEEWLFRKKMQKCPDCPKFFWNVSDLRQHAYKHTETKNFSCELCEKAFKFRSGLNRHMKEEHKKHDLISSETESAVCDIEENAAGEDVVLEQERSTFETEDCSVFPGQSGSNDGLKRKFNEDHKTVVKNENQGFGKDIDGNELVKRKFRKGEDSFETGTSNRSEMQEGCADVECSDFQEDDDKNGLCGVAKDETFQNEERKIGGGKISEKKSAMYNCNKCEAVFEYLCDFLTHQSIHK
jgi:uncharacterized C2H2 Zn-finger protein